MRQNSDSGETMDGNTSKRKSTLLSDSDLIRSSKTLMARNRTWSFYICSVDGVRSHYTVQYT